MGVTDGTVRAFVDSVAAATATPGGGSVSAFAGALAAALARMVAGLARGKKGYESVDAELVQIETRGASVQERLLALVEKDSHAYEAVLAAMRLPKATDAERTFRVDAMQSAYKLATQVPLETMEACEEVLEVAYAALEKGNRAATSDAAVAILLADAGLRGASLNARINLASIKDETVRATIEPKLDRLLAHADEVVHRALALAESRI